MWSCKISVRPLNCVHWSLSMSWLIVWFCVFYEFGWGFCLDWFKISQDEEDVSTTSKVRKPRHTITPKFNHNEDGKRQAIFIRRIHIVRKMGERIQVSLDPKR